MTNYNNISGLAYFRDKIKKIVSNNIWIPPLSFRINTVAYKEANNITDKVNKKEVFDDSNITFEYLIDLKNELRILTDKINVNKFNDFKKKYRAEKYSKDCILEKANNIKDNNPNLIENITKFLYNNGIILILKDIENIAFKYLDGFACFLDKQPIIVIYKPEDDKNYKRMIFTIAHEIFHLFYIEPEDEKMADIFAGGMLLSNMDVLNIISNIKKLNINKISAIKLLNEDKELQKELFENIYRKTGISMKAIIKTLIDYKYFTGLETNFDYLINDMKKKLKENAITVNSFNILSTEEMLNLNNMSEM